MKKPRITIIVIGILAIIFLLIFGNRMFHIIKPGERGVVFKTISGLLDKEHIRQTGLVVIAPWNVLNKYDGTRPYQSSATQEASDIAGYTGLYMGPWPDVYAYCPPAYWYGKLEFNTEAAPAGEQIPPMETMRKMMPAEDLWPISKSWELRLHDRFYPDARTALFSRYGEPTGVEEYSKKSQVLQLEAVRAMFEAFARNKYRSSGIIYWMYNSSWPSLYWQLYDYYFAPNGAFYGAKKACEQGLNRPRTFDSHSGSPCNRGLGTPDGSDVLRCEIWFGCDRGPRQPACINMAQVNQKGGYAQGLKARDAVSTRVGA